MIQPEMIFDLVLLLLLVCTAVTTMLVRNLLVSTALLSFFSLLMAVQYLILDAPDVAITEAAVGAGISTLLFLAVLRLTTTKEKPPSAGTLVTLVVIFITGAGLVYTTFTMPRFGDPEAPAQQHVAPYYLTQSQEDIGIPNVVTSILASYRGFDTLGETVVVLTAALSVLLLLGRAYRREREPKPTTKGN